MESPTNTLPAQPLPPQEIAIEIARIREELGRASASLGSAIQHLDQLETHLISRAQVKLHGRAGAWPSSAATAGCGVCASATFWRNPRVLLLYHP